MNILFLCTGNSCRSIMAEALLRELGRGKFTALSAGSDPYGMVHPLTLTLLQNRNIPTDGLSSKSWDEVTEPVDVIITVCSNTSKVPCPVVPIKAVKAHWCIPDPAMKEGNESRRMIEFERVFDMLKKRVEGLIALPPMEGKKLAEAIEALDKQEYAHA